MVGGIPPSATPSTWCPWCPGHPMPRTLDGKDVGWWGHPTHNAWCPWCQDTRCQGHWIVRMWGGGVTPPGVPGVRCQDTRCQGLFTCNQEIVLYRRLDYFVVSERLVKNVTDCVIRKGVFGSDHCPLVLGLTTFADSVEDQSPVEPSSHT